MLGRWEGLVCCRSKTNTLLAICAGNSPVPGEFPSHRPVTRSFGVFFDLRLNKRLSKQSWGRLVIWDAIVAIMTLMCRGPVMQKAFPGHSFMADTHIHGWSSVPTSDIYKTFPDSKFHGAKMGPLWGRRDTGWPHVGPMNFGIWVITAGSSQTSHRNCTEVTLHH